MFSVWPIKLKENKSVLSNPLASEVSPPPCSCFSYLPNQTSLLYAKIVFHILTKLTLLSETNELTKNFLREHIHTHTHRQTTRFSFACD